MTTTALDEDRMSETALNSDGLNEAALALYLYDGHLQRAWGNDPKLYEEYRQIARMMVEAYQQAGLRP